MKNMSETDPFLSSSSEERMKVRSRSRVPVLAIGLAKSRLSLVIPGEYNKTPLYDEHVRLGAKMVPFAGWLMPVQYIGIVAEHQAVRNAVGMFDISHMGQFIVDGTGACEWLNTMLTNNTNKLDVGTGQYTFLLNENGGIIDDLIVYRIGEQKFLLVVNAARTEEDFAWLQDKVGHASGLPDRKDRKRDACATILTNRSTEFGGVAIQGPRLVELFHALFGAHKEPPARNRIVDLPFDGMKVSVARTGYTGEDGIEVFFRATDAVKVWNAALENGKSLGIKPCGLVSFRMKDKGPPPRPHYAVFQNGERIGEVTSGTLSPSLNWGVGMAYVSTAHAKVGAEIAIEIRGQKFPAIIEKKPLYKKSTS